MALRLFSEPGIRDNSRFYHTTDGYYFHKYKTVGDAAYYKCTTSTCGARGIFRVGFELRYGHNHYPCPDYIQFMRERRHLVTRAAALTDSDARQYFNSGRTSAFPTLLTYDHLRSSIQRQRVSNLPQEPSSLALLNDILNSTLYQSIIATSHAGESLYAGSRRSGDGSVAILFMSRSCCDVLKETPSLYAFSQTLQVKESPNTFQIHVIGTLLDTYSLPLAFLLLEKDTLLTHVSGLSLLRDKLTSWLFKTVVCHDGGNVSDAYRSVFAVDVNFPFDDYIMEIGKLAKTILPEHKLNEPATIDLLNLCCGLPLVPQDLSVPALNMLRIEILKATDDLLQHCLSLIVVNIELQWIRSPVKGPKFSVSGDRDRTSNAMESAELNILSHIPNGRTGLYTFLNILKRMEQHSYADLKRLGTSSRPRTRQSNSLSDDPEIVLLTSMLVRVHGDLSTPIQNLMKVASAKRHHILLKALQ